MSTGFWFVFLLGVVVALPAGVGLGYWFRGARRRSVA